MLYSRSRGAGYKVQSSGCKFLGESFGVGFRVFYLKPWGCVKHKQLPRHTYIYINIIQKRSPAGIIHV